MHILMKVVKNRCLLDSLAKVVGHIVLKLWLEGYKNIVKRSSTIRGFHHTCSLKNQSLCDNSYLIYSSHHGMRLELECFYLGLGLGSKGFLLRLGLAVFTAKSKYKSNLVKCNMKWKFLHTWHNN